MTCLNKIFAQDLLPRKSCDRCRLVVPLVHQAVSIDTENGGVRRVDKGLKLFCDSSFLHFNLLALRDILPHPKYTYNVATYIPPRSGVEQHIDAALVLSVERELEVGSLSALKGIVEHFLNADLILLGDEILFGRRDEIGTCNK